MKLSVFLYRYFNFFCVLLLASMLVFFEVRTNFSEKLLGYYLFWQNDQRSKIGRMWDKQDKSMAARGSIEEVVAGLKELKSKAMNIASFRDLFALAEKEGDLAISKNRFVALQRDLPSELSEIFFSPFEIALLFHTSQWDRAFFMKEGSEMEVLLVDSDNRVLKKTVLDKEQIDLVRFMGGVIPKPLDQIDEFKNRIYTIEEFFHRLKRMDKYARSKIFYDPDRFLNWGGRLKRVGISEFSRSGWLKIGYELKKGLKRETVIFELNEFLVDELVGNSRREEARVEAYRDTGWEDLDEPVPWENDWDDQ